MRFCWEMLVIVSSSIQAYCLEMSAIKYRKLAPGWNLTGEVVNRNTRSSLHCSLSCSEEDYCMGYQPTSSRSCSMVFKNPAANETLISQDNSKLYLKEMCDSTPCERGGSCTLAEGYYNRGCLVCLTGWEGPNCNIDANECDSNPCQNGAACTDNIGFFSCRCPLGYTGTMCEINIDDCAPQLCQNGAACVDGIAEFECTCQSGYNGDVCELTCPVSKTFAPSSTWTTQPDFYRDMSNINCATAPRGAVTFVDGQVGKAIRFLKAEKRIVDFGVVPGNCMPKPTTCSGATLSVWLDVISCTGGEGILSTFVDYGEGISIECYNNNIQARASTTTKYGGTNGNYPAGWFHFLYVLKGPGQGMTMYIDGEFESTISAMGNFGLNAGNGKLVVGRRQTVGDKLYSSFMIDELAFFAGQFDVNDARDLYQAYQG